MWKAGAEQIPKLTVLRRTNLQVRQAAALAEHAATWLRDEGAAIRLSLATCFPSRSAR